MSETPDLQLNEEEQLRLMTDVMKETMKEVMDTRKKRIDRKYSTDQQQQHSSDEDLGSHTARSKSSAYQDDEGGPNNSPYGRRALGDDWYDIRCVRCSVCSRPVMASVTAKRGQRCVGCMKWYHDTCAPSGTLPSDKNKRECDPTTSGYFHCEACRSLYSRLQDGAAMLCGKPLANKCTITMVDLHHVRQELKPGPYTHRPGASDKQQEDSHKDNDSSSRSSSSSKSSKPFQRIARSDLRTMKQLGQGRYLKSVKKEGNDDDNDASSDIKEHSDVGVEKPATSPSSSSDGSHQSSSSSLIKAPPVSHSIRRGGLRDISALVTVFKTYDRDASQDEVLEDSWAAVLRCDGKTVTAATLLVLGTDHARLQSIVTSPAARHQGHAKLLVSELGTWLGAAGVPRLVAVLPEQRNSSRDDDGDKVLRRLHFKPLEDLAVLGRWKQEYFHYYTRDLIGQRPRVLIKQLKQ